MVYGPFKITMMNLSTNQVLKDQGLLDKLRLVLNNWNTCWREKIDSNTMNGSRSL